jgi:hypothetical protein
MFVKKKKKTIERKKDKKEKQGKNEDGGKEINPSSLEKPLEVEKNPHKGGGSAYQIFCVET